METWLILGVVHRTDSIAQLRPALQLCSVRLGSMSWTVVCVICLQLSSWSAHSEQSLLESRSGPSWMEWWSPLNEGSLWEPSFLRCELFPQSVSDWLCCRIPPLSSWHCGSCSGSSRMALSKSNFSNRYGQWRCHGYSNFLRGCVPQLSRRGCGFWVSSFLQNAICSRGRPVVVDELVCVFW